MHEFVDDPVDVVVSFNEARVHPNRLRWHGRVYDVKKVNMIHAAQEGRKRMFYFSVSDLTNYFKLQLDTETLQWRLKEIASDG